jgi:2-octaprenyl-6-methoxyphenol hydroxylase
LNTSSSCQFDAIVVGGGLNGLVAALSLGGGVLKRPMSVALVDARLVSANPHDTRATAIALSSKRLFEVLGVWGAIAPHAQEMTSIVVTDSARAASNSPTLLDFDGRGGGTEVFALMCENRHLIAALDAGVAASPLITVMRGHGVTSFNASRGLARLGLDDDRELSAACVIAADGAESFLRNAAGIEMVGWPYDQMGIAATIAHELPHGGMAHEHFTPQGPFALLPLPENRTSIVWTRGIQEAKRLLALDADAFTQELQEQIGDSLGKISLLDKPRGFPLSLRLAKEFHATRLALVGDAAHVLHPLAGLGLNLGLRDAAALADCMGEAFALGQDIGGSAVLEKYTSWRRFDTVATAIGMDGFNTLFSNANPLAKAVRDFGLQAVQRMGGLKSFFMKEAAGETGTLPKLLRGERI